MSQKFALTELGQRLIILVDKDQIGLIDSERCWEGRITLLLDKDNEIVEITLFLDNPMEETPDNEEYNNVPF